MNFLEYIPYVKESNIHVASSILVLILLIIMAAIIYRKTRNIDKLILPSKKINLENLIEVIVEATSTFARDIIGKDGEKYVPFIGTIFVYILVSNLIGLIPGFLPSTENVNTNFACAIVVFIATHYFGIKEHGFKYVKKFMAPMSGIMGLLLSFIFFPVEITSSCFRLLSLSIRLFGNINADHTVVQIISSQMPIVKNFPMLVPVPFMLLGLMVAFIQAFIFALLSMMYISLAVSHDH
jgi:F-type H+-transporting ATPase subunit a